MDINGRCPKSQFGIHVLLTWSLFVGCPKTHLRLKHFLILYTMWLAAKATFLWLKSPPTHSFKIFSFSMSQNSFSKVLYRNSIFPCVSKVLYGNSIFPCVSKVLLFFQFRVSWDSMYIYNEVWDVKCLNCQS